MEAFVHREAAEMQHSTVAQATTRCLRSSPSHELQGEGSFSADFVWCASVPSEIAEMLKLPTFRHSSLRSDFARFVVPTDHAIDDSAIAAFNHDCFTLHARPHVSLQRAAGEEWPVAASGMEEHMLSHTTQHVSCEQPRHAAVGDLPCTDATPASGSWLCPVCLRYVALPAAVTSDESSSNDVAGAVLLTPPGDGDVSLNACLVTSGSDPLDGTQPDRQVVPSAHTLCIQGASSETASNLASEVMSGSRSPRSRETVYVTGSSINQRPLRQLRMYRLNPRSFASASLGLWTDALNHPALSRRSLPPKPEVGSAGLRVRERTRTSST